MQPGSNIRGWMTCSFSRNSYFPKSFRPPDLCCSAVRNIGYNCFHAQAQTPLVISFQDLHSYCLALLQVIGDVIDTLVRDLRNMQQTILARQNAHNRTKIQQFQYGSVVYPTHLNLGSNVLDSLSRYLTAFSIDAGYHYGSIVSNIDGGAGLFGQRSDYGAPLAYDVTNFLWIDFDFDNAWGMYRDILALRR